jgi:hypothetical protein
VDVQAVEDSEKEVLAIQPPTEQLPAELLDQVSFRAAVKFSPSLLFIKIHWETLRKKRKKSIGKQWFRVRRFNTLIRILGSVSSPYRAGS